MTITAAAAAVGISRRVLSRVLDGRAAVSADLAQRLGRWLGNGAQAWLRMQAAHDLWQAHASSSRDEKAPRTGKPGAAKKAPPPKVRAVPREPSRPARKARPPAAKRKAAGKSVRKSGKRKAD